MALFKLPQNIQDQLAKLPETGMGYQIVSLVFSDGKIIKNAVVNNGEYLDIKENIDITKLKKIVVQKR